MTTKALRKAKEGIQPNAFAGCANAPAEAALAKVLGDTTSLWQELVSDLKKDLEVDIAQWHSYSVKAGWSLRLQVKKRNIVYLGPRDGWFLAAFALGDKAMAAAKKSDLPGRVLKLIAQARRYPEGTAVRIEVRDAADIEVVKTLARIKTEN